MSCLKVIAVCMLAALLTVAGGQRIAIMEATKQSKELFEENQVLAQRAEQLHGIPELNGERQEETLRETSHELLRLRNTVRQCRDQAQELEKLRQEKEHLTAVLKALAAGKALRLAEMEGYVAKDAWSDMGLAAPEAALQTLLWALQAGNVARILECMTPEEKTYFERTLGQQDEVSRKRALSEAWGPLLQIAGFRISSKEQPSENEAVLGIQAAANGAVVKLSFKRVGEQWKFADAN